MASITTRIQLPYDHRENKSLCLQTSDSRVRFWLVIVNGAQSRSKLRCISKAKLSIRSCIGHKYVYVYELGCRIVALKSWYPYFRFDTPTFMNETTTETPRRVHSSRPTMTRLGTRFDIRLDPDKTSHHKTPWSLEAARFVFKIVPSLWNLRGTSAAMAPVKIFKTTRKHILFSRLRDFRISYFKSPIGVLSDTDSMESVVLSILTRPSRARS